MTRGPLEHEHNGRHSASARERWQGLDEGQRRRAWRVHRHRRRRMFLRLWVAFGVVTLGLSVGLAGLVYAVATLLRPGGTADLLPWLIAAASAVLFPLLAVLVARRAFRGYAAPLSDLISAADRIAAGDLTARVTEAGRGDLARLTRSFNRMAEQLDHAEELRQNLTADVAHELRTPLQIIQGNLEGILDDVYEPDEEHLLSTLRETRSLGRLVDDLRTLSVAEAGQLRLLKETVVVRELLQDIATSVSGQAEAAGVELAVNIDAGEKELTLTGDEVRLGQVLSNLVANALRYCERGQRITLGAAATDSGVRLTVTDTGRGIPEQDLPFLFDRFWRGKDGGHGEGTGLGLAIARQLVQAQGGQIQVESQPDQGTTFTIDLPAAVKIGD
ncbi:MAG TPA: ATP-binding protein [Anaerolineae bacterium]|nr:ATP-binding protein [Anaerolineae bacterium]